MIETQIHGLEDKIFQLFFDSLWVYWTTFILKNSSIFSHLPWFMHGNFNETPADWKKSYHRFGLD